MSAAAERVYIVHNPFSGRPSTNRRVRLVADRLRTLGREVCVGVTQYPGHGSELAARAADNGFGLVVAAGGDGTINEVLQPLVGSEVILGVIPIGTVNIWASESGVRTNVASIASVLHQRAVRRIDVGTCGGRHFLLMASLGLDAAVVQGVAPALKRRIGRLAYGVALSGLMRDYRGAPVRLYLDGQVLDTTALMLVVSNTQRYGGMIRAAPHAMADDGRLDLTIVRGERVWAGLPQAGAIMSGIASLRRRILSGRASTIEVESLSPMPIQLDGDFHGFTPARFDTFARALRVVVGPGTMPGLFSNTPGIDDALPAEGQPKVGAGIISPDDAPDTLTNGADL